MGKLLLVQKINFAFTRGVTCPQKIQILCVYLFSVCDILHYVVLTQTNKFAFELFLPQVLTIFLGLN